MLEVISRPADEWRSRTPLLFIHGAWHGAWCWDRGWLDFFAGRGWDSYALSLRHHGKSEGEGSLRFTRHDGYVADIAEVAGRFDRPPVLIGHSMGGYVAQKYMENHEAAAVVLVASVPVTGTLGASWRIARRHPIQFAKLLLTLRLWPLVATEELARDLLLGPETDDGEVAEIHALLQDESFFTYLDMMGLALPKPEKTHAPVMVCAGSADVLFTVGEAEKTADAYGVEPLILDGFPHDMMLHHRWEELAVPIARFLEEVT